MLSSRVRGEVNMHNKETCKVIGCGTCDTTASKLLRDFSKNKCTLDVCREHKGMMCSQCRKEYECDHLLDSFSIAENGEYFCTLCEKNHSWKKL